MQASRTRWLKALAGAAGFAALAGIFLMYTRPEFLVLVADRVWSCF